MSRSTIENAAPQRVIMLGCFDTKGEEFHYLYSCLMEKGLHLITLNTGTLGSTDLFPVDIEAEQIAQAAGTELSTIRKEADRGTALDIMGRGAAKVVEALVAENKVHGIISMGGGGGTFVTLMAMQAVPFGIPKLCLSTIATKDLSDKVKDKDILLMPSIVDIAGLNSISRTLIAQAAGALHGMMQTEVKSSTKMKGSIAISVFGNTSDCANVCTELLRAEGYDVLSFHAVGSGGKTMEYLIREGFFKAVLDLTTTELVDELCGGICASGPDRLTAAAIKGIPQVVIPGCLDMVNFGSLDSIPEKYRSRQLFSWAPDVTLMRTNAEENRILGQQIAKKVNASKGPVTLILPLGGLSKIGGQGEIFHQPHLDKILFEAIKDNVSEAVQVEEVDSNINTSEFAKKAVEALLQQLQ